MTLEQQLDAALRKQDELAAILISKGIKPQRVLREDIFPTIRAPLLKRIAAIQQQLAQAQGELEDERQYRIICKRIMGALVDAGCGVTTVEDGKNFVACIASLHSQLAQARGRLEKYEAMGPWVPAADNERLLKRLQTLGEPNALLLRAEAAEAALTRAQADRAVLMEEISGAMNSLESEIPTERKARWERLQVLFDLPHPSDTLLAELEWLRVRVKELEGKQ